MVIVSVATTPEDIDAVRGLMRVYTTWAVSLDPESDQAPTFQGLEEELAGLPGVYSRLFLARSGGEPAGIIALKPHDGTTAEIKRLYVDPSFRGQKIGDILVGCLLEEARAIGFRRLVLDSYHAMHTAHALYRRHGFVTCGPPPGFPEHLLPKVVFMEIDLD